MNPPTTTGRVTAGLVSGALIVGALAFTAPAAQAAPAEPGAKVLILNDPGFVDTMPVDQATAENPSREGVNMVLALREQGHQVTELTGTDAATISAALEGQDTFVIPELERGAWVPALDEAARGAVTSWVRDGGTLVVAGDEQNTLNDLFGFSLTSRYSGATYAKTTAANSVFAGEADSLPWNDGSYSYAVDSVPEGAQVHYRNETDAAVVTFPQAKGTAVSLAWDWYDAAPLGSQDGGWNSVLDTAVRLAPVAVEPPAEQPAEPSNAFVLPGRGAANAKNGSITIWVRIPGVVGRVTAGSAPAGVLKSTSRSIGPKRSVPVTLRPTAKTLRELRAQLRTKRVATKKVKVNVTYTPQGGKARTLSKTVTLKLTKPAKKGKKK